MNWDFWIINLDDVEKTVYKTCCHGICKQLWVELELVFLIFKNKFMRKQKLSEWNEHSRKQHSISNFYRFAWSWVYDKATFIKDVLGILSLFSEFHSNDRFHFEQLPTFLKWREEEGLRTVSFETVDIVIKEFNILEFSSIIRYHKSLNKLLKPFLMCPRKSAFGDCHSSFINFLLSSKNKVLSFSTTLTR